MSERSFVPHVENNVRMRGAPGMDFGMDNARALRDAGNGLNDFGRGALVVGAAMRDFVERKADTQNKLMATQTDNLYLAIQEELNNRMAANPASYKEFPKWADAADQRFLDESRQYTDQMTTDFREMYYARKEHDRIQDLSRRQMIATQSEVTNQYNMMQEQLKSAIERGDAKGYKAILDEHVGVLISQNEYDLRMSEYDKLAESSAAKRLVDLAAQSGSVPQAQDILKKLQERDSDGNFVNFKHIASDYRDQLIRAANTAQNKAELEARQAFVASAIDGNMPTLDALKQQHDAGELTDAQYAEQVSLVKQFQSEEERDANKAENEADQQFLAGLFNGNVPTETELRQQLDDGAITNEQFNRRMGWLKQFQSEEERQTLESYAAELTAGNTDNVPYKTVDELVDALKRDEITASEFNDYYRVLTNHLSGIEQQRKALDQAKKAQEQAYAQQQDDIASAIKFDLAIKKYPLSPEAAYQAANEDFKQACAAIHDPKRLKDVLDAISKKLNDTLSFKEDEFQTDEGKAVLRFIQSKYMDDGEFQGLKWDPWGPKKDKSQAFMRARYYEITEVARAMLRKGESPEKIESYIKGEVGKLNNGKIKQILLDVY